MKKYRYFIYLAAAAVLFLLIRNPFSSVSKPDDPIPSPAAAPSPAATAEPSAPVYQMEDYYSLQHTEHFLKSTLEHLFLGTVKNGEASGYHYDGIADTPGSIIPGTKSEPDAHGVYAGQVIVNGIPKTSYDGYSTFFPESWSPQDVIDKINDVYDHCELIEGILYGGLTEEGMEIDIVIRESDGMIITAYPILEEE